MPYKTRPTIRRRLLGRKLEQARDEANLSVEEVSVALGITKPSIYRMESGHTAVKPSLVPKFAALYGVQGDRAQVRRWERLAEMAKKRGPWAASGTMVGPTFVDYADAESMAEELHIWQPLCIPGLLQTEAYSRAMIRADTPVYPTDAREYPVDDWLKLREERKNVLDRDRPPRIWAVIGEAAIRTPPGEQQHHQELLKHLLHIGETKATIQILPFRTGLHAGIAGAFDLITINGDEIAFREGYGDGSFMDDEKEVRTYRARYDQLRAQALPIEDSRRYLHQVLAEM